MQTSFMSNILLRTVLNKCILYDLLYFDNLIFTDSARGSQTFVPYSVKEATSSHRRMYFKHSADVVKCVWSRAGRYGKKSKQVCFLYIMIHDFITILCHVGFTIL